MWIPERRRVRPPGTALAQRGTAAVEFLIALPFMLLMLLVVAEFGQVMFQYNTLTKTVRDAARYLSQNAVVGATGTVLIDATDMTEAKNLVVYGNIAGSGSPLLPGLGTGDVTVICQGGGTSCPGVEYIQINAQYAYQPILGTTLPGLGLMSGDISLGLTLSTSVVMRAL
jgi:Flp pilus assembly protein TadG